MEEKQPYVSRCTLCYKDFTEEEIKDVSSCPSCGCAGLHCDPKEDVKIKINWHELRILGIRT